MPGRPVGLASAIGIALLSALLARMPGMESSGLGWLPLSVLVGMAAGNLWPALSMYGARGLHLARGPLMRAGIALFGLRIGFADLGAAGIHGAVAVVLMVASTLLLADWLGRLLGVERDLRLLIGCGSAICGAAAVAAADGVIGARARHVSAAVLAVVVFGSACMFLLPALQPLLGMDAHQFGMWVGLSVHELGHVVAAASAGGGDATAAALVEKMGRVMLLAPVLMLLARGLRRTSAPEGGGRTPVFACVFVLMMLLNGSGLLPPAVQQAGVMAAQLLLAIGLAALGMQTRLSDMGGAGVRVWLLAGGLCIHLVVGAAILVLIGAWS
jgi:uncharacterized integral membrane protein (TIGR00698 family)